MPASGHQRSQQPLILDQNGNLRIEITNAGSGVALDIQAVAKAHGQVTAAETWHKANIAPGALVALMFQNLMYVPDEHQIVQLDYRDLANRSHSTTIMIDTLIAPGLTQPRIFLTASSIATTTGQAGALDRVLIRGGAVSGSASPKPRQDDRSRSRDC